MCNVVVSFDACILPKLGRGDLFSLQAQARTTEQVEWHRFQYVMYEDEPSVYQFARSE
jgi:hypothetical protein